MLMKYLVQCSVPAILDSLTQRQLFLAQQRQALSSGSSGPLALPRQVARFGGIHGRHVILPGQQG